VGIGKTLSLDYTYLWKQICFIMMCVCSVYNSYSDLVGTCIYIYIRDKHILITGGMKRIGILRT
jgi:hypothetical protein